MRVMTANIAGMRFTDLQRLGDVIKKRRVTAIGVQEVADTSNYMHQNFYDQVEALAVYCGLRNTVHSSYKPFANHNGTYGNAILSRWPIIRSEVRNLPQTAHTTQPRTAIKVVLWEWWRRRETTLICTHLSGGNSDLANAERILHMQHINNMLQGENGVKITLGDFNDLVDRESYQYAEELLGKSVNTPSPIQRDFVRVIGAEPKAVEIIRMGYDPNDLTDSESDHPFIVVDI